MARTSFALASARTLAHDVAHHKALIDASMPVYGIVGDHDPALAKLLEHEGGNDDDPRDPGGRTSRGIIQSEWTEWRRTHPGLPADVWQAPQGSVIAIYDQKYWATLRCDQLPAGVDYAVFDYGVNSGVSRSAKVLQRLVGANPDGVIGSQTVGLAVAFQDKARLVNAICDERLAFLQGLKTWRTFGNGWGRRVREVRELALQMVAKADKPGIVVPLRPSIAGADQLAGRIVAAMRKRGMNVADGADKLTIAYVRGMNVDGMPNNDAPDKFNDLRCLIRNVGGVVTMVKHWPCTTDPGKYYVTHRINPAGAAQLKDGQYQAWIVGVHRGNHEALVQDGGEVTVLRDANEDFRRDGDKPDTGYFGINQHGPSGHDEVLANVGAHSAGCLVAESMVEHREFMRLVKTDSRFAADRHFVFETALLPAAEI